MVKAAVTSGWKHNQLHVPIVLQRGSLTLLEPSGPLKACTGIVFFTLHIGTRSSIRSLRTRHSVVIRTLLIMDCVHHSAENLCVDSLKSFSVSISLLFEPNIRKSTVILWTLNVRNFLSTVRHDGFLYIRALVECLTFSQFWSFVFCGSGHSTQDGQGVVWIWNKWNLFCGVCSLYECFPITQEIENEHWVVEVSTLLFLIIFILFIFVVAA